MEERETYKIVSQTEIGEFICFIMKVNTASDPSELNMFDGIELRSYFVEKEKMKSIKAYAFFRESWKSSMYCENTIEDTARIIDVLLSKLKKQILKYNKG